MTSAAAQTTRRLDHGSFGVPARGERVSGDAVVVVEGAGGLFVAVLDLLGHGPEAHAGARRCAAALRGLAGPDVAGAMRQLHAAAVGTVGAVALVGWVDAAGEALAYVSVGNIGGAVTRPGGASESLEAQAGVVGQRLPALRPARLALGAGAVLMVHSDGIPERSRRALAPSAWRGDARTVARDLVLQHGRDHDDVSCFVCRVLP
jgi:serine phosphatase RsbU (regulator of sigma subunit)